MSEWIDFEEIAPNPKTKRWRVIEKANGGLLGYVYWFAQWRKYSFFPYQQTVFEEVCLRNIADFCERQTLEHRNAKRAPAFQKQIEEAGL